MEPYSDDNYPVSLPCGHTISVSAAAAILARSTAAAANTFAFTCPNCRAETNVSGAHQFPKNYAVLELMSSDQASPPTAPTIIPTVPAITIPPPLPHSSSAGGASSSPEFFAACDISGSMGALVNDALGLTRLDLVMYNVVMLLRRLAGMESSMGAEPPRVTITTFNVNSTVIINREIVTPDTLDTLIAKVNGLRPMSTTNIKGALRHLMDLMIPGRNNIAIILTDGQPTNEFGRVEPDDPSDYVRILREYIGRYRSVSMMGYGSRLSHRIMFHTARAGGGSSSFGSDETMISNVFIRWIGWALTEGQFTPDADISSVADSIVDSFDRHTQLFQTGVWAGNDVEMRGKLSWAKIHSTYAEDLLNEMSGDSSPGGGVHLAVFCRMLERSIILQNPETLLRLINSPLALRLDIRLIDECRCGGQIEMAFQPKYFGTWGKAYLYATLRGHEMRHQWNFKDESLKIYATPGFNEEVAVLDRIFQMMPAPAPSKAASESVVAHGGMGNVFNNSSSTCWVEGSAITLADGTSILVQNIKAGMKVTSYDPVACREAAADVIYVIRQDCHNGIVQAVPLGIRGMACMTPNHPVLDMDRSPYPGYSWPCNYYTPEDYNSKYVYNFILDRHHHIISDGVVCVTMGHGMTEAKVIQLGYGGADVVPHTYFGDMGRVMSDCMKIGVDADGYITVDMSMVVRDRDTGYVTSFTGC